jgi:predicted GNAT superfamily acetyltransferase
MSIEIRPIQTHEEYRAAEDLQRAVWALEDARLVPDNIMITMHKNGGVVLGAFDTAEQPPRLIGYVQGFVGLRDGKLKHCSHQLGILPDYQNQQIGYRLKLAQRGAVQAQGIDLMTWTHDPLESRNAYLNIHKLGAICRTYLRNVYGEMRDALNQGLPSDRFEVEWHLNSDRVTRHLANNQNFASFADLQTAEVPIVNPSLPGELPTPPAEPLPLEQKRLLIQIPASFQAVKASDLQQALLWREQIRFLLETVFAAGYTVIDVLKDGQQRYYLLQKDLEVV